MSYNLILQIEFTVTLATVKVAWATCYESKQVLLS